MVYVQDRVGVNHSKAMPLCNQEVTWTVQAETQPGRKLPQQTLENAQNNCENAAGTLTRAQLVDAEILLMEVNPSQDSHMKMRTGGNATVPNQELH